MFSYISPEKRVSGDHPKVSRRPMETAAFTMHVDDLSQGPVFCKTHLYATAAARTVDSRYTCIWMNGENAFF
jgi:hypothetical protein